MNDIMDDGQFSFDDSAFAYILTSNQHKSFEKHSLFSNSNLVMNYSKNTDWLAYKCDSEEIGIVGCCVDSHKEIARMNIPSYLLEVGDGDILNVAEATKRLAGKYAIFYANNKSIYVITDATASLPVNYSIEANDICVSFCDNLIAKLFGFEISTESLDIRANSDLSQPFPYNITICDEIKCLLPNHYLDLLTNDAIRYAPSIPELKRKRDAFCINDIIMETIRKVDNIVAEYARNYKLVCALSGGWDSRVILSFLNRHTTQTKCCTWKHRGLNEDSGDLVVPPQICRSTGNEHVIIEDLAAPDVYVQRVKGIIGELYSNNTINMAFAYANTFGPSLRDSAFISGDIIGHVGKSFLGSLPIWCATTSFFVAKQHGFSRYTKLATEEYLEAVRVLGLFNEIYDLFAIENRCGRWVSQSGMICSVCGMAVLNIFNCREIIESWMCIPRKMRKDKIIHRSILEIIDPMLLSFPFNPTDRFGWIRDNAPTFLLATYAKYCLTKLQHSVTRIMRD